MKRNTVIKKWIFQYKELAKIKITVSTYLLIAYLKFQKLNEYTILANLIDELIIIYFNK